MDKIGRPRKIGYDQEEYDQGKVDANCKDEDER